MLSKLLVYNNTPLPANGSFISPWQEAPWASEVIVYVLADQAGALVLEGSEDQSAISFSRYSTYTANAHLVERWPRLARYYRIRFVNGGSAQTSFRLALWAFDLYH
jgi:hypothetical protein